MIKVTICGISSPAEAREVIAAGADALGFHIELEHAKSPCPVETVAQIIAGLPPYCASVLVTTLSRLQEVAVLVTTTRANTMQYQGDSSLGELIAIREKFPYLKIYRVIHVFDDHAIGEAKQYEGVVDAVLLDTANKDTGQRGGTGKSHDWNISRRVVESTSVPIILAGGLNPDNVVQAITTVHPFAVDVESGVSNLDGSKNLEKVKLFIARAKGVLL